MRTKDAVRVFLGLGAREHKVFQALSPTKPQTTVSVAQAAHISHASAQYVLKSLHVRSLARVVRTTSGRKLWKRPSAGALKRLVNHSADLLLGTDVVTPRTSTRSLFDSTSTHVEAIRGSRALTKVYARAFAGHPGERTFLTQLAPTLAHVRKQQASPGQLDTINQVGKQHGGILEIIMSKHTKSEYIALAKEWPEWVETIKGRLVDISVVPEEFFKDINHELFIFRDYVMVTDWATETGVLIQNKELAQLLLAGFRVVHGLGESFNTYNFIKMLEDMIGGKIDGSSPV